MSDQTISHSFMCKIYLHFYDLFLTRSSIPSQLFVSIKFREFELQRLIICDKTLAQLLKTWLLSIRQTLSIKSMYEKWSRIRNHALLYDFLLFTVSEIPYCMCVSIKFYKVSYSISYSLLLLLSPSCLFLSYS